MFADLCQRSVKVSGCQCQWILQVFLKFTRICGDFWRGPGHVCSRAIALYIRSGPVTTSTWNLATAPTLDILGHSSLLKTGKNCQEMTTNVLKKSTCLLNFWLVSVFKMHRNEIRCPQLPDTKGNHFQSQKCNRYMLQYCQRVLPFNYVFSSPWLQQISPKSIPNSQKQKQLQNTQ